MRFWLIAVLLVGAIVPFMGCGGTSMEDMKRNAIRRKKDTDEPAPAVAAGSPPSVPTAPAPPGATPPAPSPTIPNSVPPAVHQAASAAPAPQAASAAALPPTPARGASGVSRVAARESRPEEKPTLPLSDVQRRTKTLSHLTSLGAAMQAYLEENNGFPAPVISGPGGTPLLSWRVEILPYLGYHELYKKFHLDEPWDSDHNRALLAEIPPEFQSPERFDDRTNYLAPVAASTAFNGRRGTSKRRFGDGLSNTVILLEVDDNRAVPWTQPNDYAYDAGGPDANTGTLRQDGFFVVWGDGQIGRIPRGSHPDALRAIFTIDGHEDYARADIQQPATPEVSAVGAVASTPRSRATESIDLDDAGDPGASSVPAKVATRPVATRRPPEVDNDLGVNELQSSGSDALPTGDLAEQAAAALAEGRERDAFQLYYAAALASPPEDSWHQAMRWVPALQRPVLAIRWGFGVQYSGAPTATLAPIGRTTAVSISDSASGAQQLVAFGGELGDKMLEEMKFRLESGRWGMVYAAGENSPRGQRRVTVDPNLPISRQVHNISPGISYLGRGTRKELNHSANQEGIDVLLIFEIVTKPNRSRIPLNSTSLTVIDVQRNKTLYTSPALSNIKVLKQREDRLQEDPIAAWVEKYFAFVDENFLTGDLPSTLKPEHAASRVANLTTAKHDNPLPALVETRLYHDRQLISDDQLLAAYQAMLGERSGSRLIDGDEDQRREVLSKWLPRAPRGKAALTRVED